MMDNNRTLLLAVLTAAAFAGVYILWGPNRRRVRRAQVPGLVNLGRSCFLNAVLQALASCRTIVDWLEALEDSRRRKRPTGSAAYLLTSLFAILRVLNRLPERRRPDTAYDSDVADAGEVLRALRAHRWIIANDEQDAHEMFHVLTSTMEEEVRARSSAPCTLADLGELEASVSVHDGVSSSRLESLPLTFRREVEPALPFRGLLASQLVCRSCHAKSPVKFDSFDSLSLSIPTGSWTRPTLHGCLRDFVKPEQVHEVECDGCSRLALDDVKVKSTFVKQLAIGKLPEVLCIHIQRMAWLDNGIPVKKYEHVVFPEMLCVSEFVYSHQQQRSRAREIGLKAASGCLVGGSGNDATVDTSGVSTDESRPGQVQVLTPLPLPIATSVASLGLRVDQRLTGGTSAVVAGSVREKSTYRLRAVIVHLGDVHSGHFVTYRRGTVGGDTWCLCSDMAVRPVTVREVLACDAYMLLYERNRARTPRIGRSRSSPGSC